MNAGVEKEIQPPSCFVFNYFLKKSWLNMLFLYCHNAMYTLSLMTKYVNYELTNLLIASYDVDSVGTNPLL